MTTWEGYFAVERLEDLGEGNWTRLVAIIDELQGVGRDANQQLRNRPTVSPDGFWWDTGLLNQEDEPILRWYGNSYIYAANFPIEAVQFEKFAGKLETIFELPSGSVTYTTKQITLRNRPTVIATYAYDLKNYFTVSLLGCATDGDLCTTIESNQEVLQLIYDQPKWGENNG